MKSPPVAIYSVPMDTVYSILEALESDASRLFKEDLLRKHRSNDLLRRTFVAAGDPYTNYYVSKFKMPAASPTPLVDNDRQLAAFLDVLLPDLSSRKIVGNEAKSVVGAAFQMMTPLQQKWCLRILLRNLRVGVLETTVNKVWPGAIAKFSVQLAETLKSHFEPGKGLVIDGELSFPVRVEPKLDGLRCVAVKNNGEVTMFTRNGTVLDTLPTIKAALESAPWDNFVLDGESLGSDWNESASVVMSRKNNKDDSGIKYHVFDAMELEDWRDQKSTTDLESRTQLVADLISGLPPGSPVVQVPGETVDCIAGLMKFYSTAMEEGHEGIMVKDLNAAYCFKRSDSVMKLKPVTTWEGVVVGNYEGKRGSKREGLWGGFEVLLPNGIVTRVAGGFTDRQKAEINLDPASWIGRVIEMEGQPDPLTDSGLTRDGRVRFPVFVRERDPSDVDPKVLEAFRAYAGAAP